MSFIYYYIFLSLFSLNLSYEILYYFSKPYIIFSIEWCFSNNSGKRIPEYSVIHVSPLLHIVSRQTKLITMCKVFISKSPQGQKFFKKRP